MGKNKNLKALLQKKLSKEELSLLVRGFDQLGNIAIIEIPKELEKKQKLIGEGVLKLNKSIKTVCKIKGEHKGKYRIQPIEIIAGEKNFIAHYKEFGCRFEFDVRKTFFSPRLGNERKRICEKIKKGEIVGVFFAGIGPFAVIFAKNSPLKKAVAIELNPQAFKYLEKNISLNKVEEKVEAIKGDVKKVVPKKFKKTFNRIVMPLPKGGENFLKEAILALKPKGIIHFYQFVLREEMFKEPLKKIEKNTKALKKRFKILLKKQVRSFSPSRIQVVIDFKVF